MNTEKGIDMAKEEAQQFTDILAELDDGLVIEQLTKELPKLVKAVRETQKKGALTLVINCNPDGHRTMFLTADVKVKAPMPKTGLTLFYTTVDGQLRREDPQQPALKNVPLKPPTRLRRPDEDDNETTTTSDEPTKGA